MPTSSENRAEQQTVLPPGLALHARPAGALVREASRFAASVEIVANGKRANAKSILEILALGATMGAELVFVASGQDAAEAVSHLTAFLDALGPTEQVAGHAKRVLL